jgi:hypothetical protein
MKTLLAVTLGAVLLAGAARAGTPFGGDDSGFVPTNKVDLICAQKALLLASKTAYSIAKCHIDLASKALKGEGIGNSEDACENSTTSKLSGQLNKLFAQQSCNACLVADTATLGADLEAAGDAGNGSVYCAGTTSYVDIGQLDDTGFVPSDATTFKCEASVGKNLAKLDTCIAKCHGKMAKYMFAGKPFDEEACESTDPLRSCRTKYNRVRDKIAPLCPPCLDAAAQNTLADNVEANADNSLGSYYCASPSGAFVD